MNNTDYLELKLPEGSDFYKISDANDNMEAIDAKIEEMDEQLTTQINAAPITFQKPDVISEPTSGSTLTTIVGAFAKGINSLITHLRSSSEHVSNADRLAWNAKAGTSTATQTSNGLESSSDKTKLDGIDANANNYSHPNPARTNATSSSTPGYSGTFTVVDSVTSNSEGHITKVNTKTVSMPEMPSKSDIGLGNVDNTADTNKSVKSAETLPYRGISTLAELNSIASTYAIASVTLVAAITLGTEIIPRYAKGVVYGNKEDASAIFTSVLDNGESWSATWLNGTWRANKIYYKSGLVDLIYPVGSIYMSVNSTSPASLFGGTWVQLKDRFLVGTGSSYSNDSTGGSSSTSYTPNGTVGDHTLTVSEIPSHTHTQGGACGNNAGGTNILSGAGYYYNPAPATGSTGGDAAHNHPFTGSAASIPTVPPYLAVNMWKRTA